MTIMPFNWISNGYMYVIWQITERVDMLLVLNQCLNAQILKSYNDYNVKMGIQDQQDTAMFLIGINLNA